MEAVLKASEMHSAQVKITAPFCELKNRWIFRIKEENKKDLQVRAGTEWNRVEQSGTRI